MIGSALNSIFPKQQSGQLPPSNNPISTRPRVLIISGQSNARGYGARRANIPDSKSFLEGPFTDIKIWSGSTFVNIEAGINTDEPNNHNDGVQSFGVEVNYGWLIQQFWQDSQIDYVIKWTNDGEAISEWLDGGGNRNAFVTWVNNALINIDVDNNNYSCVFYWDQGEADAKVNLALAEAYESKFVQMMTDFRLNLNVRSLPVLIRKHKPDVARAYISEIISQQISIEQNVIDCQLINSNDLPLFDNVHLNANSQIEMGRRVMEKAIYLFD